tara:strand:+ start:482 stop:979 length:498 start_codon:yes stop_codon:yes gene_type:complete
MARTKSTERAARPVPRRQLAIAKNPPPPMMRMPPFFHRVMKEIDAAKKAFDAIGMWECKDKAVFGGGCANKHFGLVVKSFQMKPMCRFSKKDSEQTELETTILVEVPANYPFDAPHITFTDKQLDHPSIDLHGRYIGKALQLWSPVHSLAEYITSVQYELLFALA